MFQKFFSDTLMSRFIKNLLSKESIPLLDFVKTGDILIKDCLYIYGHFIIKCVESGNLNVPDNESLTPSSVVYPLSISMLNKDIARFQVLSHYNEDEAKKISYCYNSSVHWYDSETHRYLGNYLRYIRDYKHVDLMPYYNCFNGYEIDNVRLSVPTLTTLFPSNTLYPNRSLYPGILQLSTNNFRSSDYSLTHNDMYRVIAVPIKFGKTYTIAIDCPTNLCIRSVIYSNSCMVKVPNTEDKYYTDLIDNSYVLKSHTRFNQPFLYSVKFPEHLSDEDKKQLYTLQRNLFMFIQFPVTVTSSIVVLEGDYVTVNGDYYSDPERKNQLYYNLSLLRLNTKETYAFSDRLIEYLLANVITEHDEFYDNIANVQDSLARIDTFYRELVDSNRYTRGAWDSNIPTSISKVIDKYKHEVYFQDQDGYINKDIEDLLLRRGNYRV